MNKKPEDNTITKDPKQDSITDDTKKNSVSEDPQLLQEPSMTSVPQRKYFLVFGDGI